MSDQPAERHGRISELFAELFDLSTDERTARLEALAADDAALAEELAELLVLASRRDVLEDVGPLLAAADEPDVGGRFRPDEVLGAGGGGVVWRAEQLRPVRRWVALKVSSFAAADEDVRARIRFEGEALAQLQHEHVAAIHEVGVTRDDRPYLAMELVEGPTIDRYADVNGLQVRDRVALVAALCRGVAHAHSRGILHRDVKPANVLVAEEDGRPVPKLIDFGVARSFDGPLAARSRLTRTGQISGTLAYLAPEQLGDGRPDVRTDVHGVGALLYELLTGEPPVGRATLEGGDPGELVHRIRSVEPPRASERARRELVTDPRSARDLREELDWILAKALAREPDRRYATVTELAEDLERFLGREPIEARPPSRAYRLSRLWRRRRLELTAAGLVIVATLGGLGGTTAGLLAARDQAAAATGALGRERSARRAADERADEVEAINEFLTDDLLANASPFAGREPTLQELVDQAAATVGERFAGAPRIEASIRETLAMVYSTQGRLEEADVHARRAIELFEQLGDPVEAARMRLEHAGVVSSLGDAPGAVAMATESLAVLRAAAFEAEATGATPPALAMPIARVAGLVAQMGRFEESAALCAEAMPMLRATLPASHRSVMEVAAMYGIVLDGVGRTQEAADMLTETVAAARADGASDRERVVLESSLVGILVRLGRYDEAAPLASEHVAIAMEVFGPGNPYAINILNNSALVLAETAPLDEALAARDLVIEQLESIAGPNHPNTLAARGNRGALLRRHGRLAEATAELEDVCRSADAALPADSVVRWRLKSSLGETQELDGRLEAAAATFEAAWAGLSGAAGAENPYTLKVAERLAEIHAVRGDEAAAAAWRARAAPAAG